MNYQRIYQEIISNAKSRNLEGYSERHHIKPRCMKGKDTEDNLVNLTAREHFICHMLLVKMFPKNHKLKRAFWCMASMDRYGKRYRCSSRVFEIARKAMSEATSKQMLGKKLSAETKAKMSSAQKGKKLSAEHKAKMSASIKGKKISAETKAKMSSAQKGSKNYRFTGWYCTPAGKFASSYEAAGPNGVSYSSIQRWCRQNKLGYSFEPAK